MTPRILQWDSSSPSFNERCQTFLELMGQETFDMLLEPFVLWGDRPVPVNVPEDKFPRVYKAMAENHMFIEALFRMDRRGMAHLIHEEAAP